MIKQALISAASLFLLLIPLLPAFQAEDSVTCRYNTIPGTNCTVEAKFTQVLFAPPECPCDSCRKIKIELKITCESTTCIRTRLRCDDVSDPVSGNCGGQTFTLDSPGQPWGDVFDSGSCSGVTISVS